MKDLQIFKNPEFGEVRTVNIDGEPWLVGKDVATALGYVDTFGALKKHVDDEDKQNCQNDSFESPRLLHRTRRRCPAKPAGERQHMPADSFLVYEMLGN